MRVIPTITRARILEAVSYDPETGLFTNLIKRSGLEPGTITGNPNAAGYIQLMIDGQFFYGHILAWFIMTGEWPERKIDHRDLNKGNNRWKNLRKAGDSENCFNRPIQTNNKSGFKGVAYFKGNGRRAKPWCAEIRANKKRVWSAYFATPEEAASARAAQLTLFHGEFARQ